jgi:hypothetical protein
MGRSGPAWVSWTGWAGSQGRFQINLDFGKTLRISTRRFRRNLDMRIFPKFL